MIILLACLLVSILCYEIGMLRVPGTTQTEAKIGSAAIVICVRDGQQELDRHIDAWTDQNIMPPLDLHIIDDGSIVDLQMPERAGAQLHRSDTPVGKKQALAQHLQQLSYDHYLLTDVDCYPAGSQWARLMLSPLAQADIVLGHSPFVKQAGILNLLVRLENTLIAIRYFAMAGRGCAYMGVGRNLAYGRSMLRHYPSDVRLSGDDDLLVSAAQAAGAKITCQYDPSSWCWTYGPRTLGEWIRTKRRHISTSVSYGFRQKIELLCYPSLLLAFYACLIAVTWHAPILGLAALTLRMIGPIQLRSRWRTIWTHQDSLLAYPMLEPILLCVYLYLGAAMMIKPEVDRWK